MQNNGPYMRIVCLFFRLTATANVKFGMEIHHTCTYKCCMKRNFTRYSFETWRWCENMTLYLTTL